MQVDQSYEYRKDYQRGRKRCVRDEWKVESRIGKVGRWSRRAVTEQNKVGSIGFSTFLGWSFVV